MHAINENDNGAKGQLEPQYQDPGVENLDAKYSSTNFMVEDKDKTTYSIQEQESVQKLNANFGKFNK